MQLKKIIPRILIFEICSLVLIGILLGPYLMGSMLIVLPTTLVGLFFSLMLIRRGNTQNVISKLEAWVAMLLMIAFVLFAYLPNDRINFQIMSSMRPIIDGIAYQPPSLFEYLTTESMTVKFLLGALVNGIALIVFADKNANNVKRANSPSSD